MSGSLFTLKKVPMKAAIDIGTNTVLLMVGKVQGKTLKVIHEEQRVPRLGRGVDHTGNLSDEAIQRVVSNLREYRQIIEVYYPEVHSVTVTATSAVRDANNRGFFIRKLKEDTGFHVQVLSGLEEARCTYLGAISMVDNVNSSGNTVIDIGGGSTEVIIGTGRDIADRHSFDMGCVRFTERYLRQPKDNRVSKAQVSRCRTAIRELLGRRIFAIADSAAFVGVAGTVTSLAYMELELKSYLAEEINGVIIPKETIEKWIKQVQSMTYEELLKKYPEVMEGRADIFLAGLLILSEFMNYYNLGSIRVSTGGIRHGILL